MIRLWRSLIGIAWGSILGAIVMCIIKNLLNHESTIATCIAYGLPMLCGFIGGVIENWWEDFWTIIVYPLIAFALIALTTICIYLILDAISYAISTFTKNPLESLFILGLISFLFPGVATVIVIIIKGK